MSDQVIKLSKSADQLIAANRLTDAANIYRKICKIDQNNPSAWIALGSITANLKQFKDAETAFRKANKLQDGTGQAAEYLAQTLEIQGNYSEAIKVLSDVYNHTSNINLTLKIGILYARKEEYSTSIDWLNKYIKINNNNAYAHHCMASAYEATDDYNNASHYYLRAISLDPSSYQIFSNYGAFLQKQGDFDGALDIYHKSIKINDQYPISHHNIASTYYALGNYKEAQAHYTYAIQLNPEYVEAYVGLGRSHRSLGDSDAAIVCFNKALEIDDKCVSAYANLGRALITRGQNKRALEAYSIAHSIDPDNIDIECSIASVHERKGEFDAARSIIDRLLTRAPDNKYVAIAYGAISRKFNEREKAIDVLNSALLNKTLSPTDRSDIHFVIGKLFDDISEYDNAFKHFKLANELLPFNFNKESLDNSVKQLKNAFSKDKLTSYNRNRQLTDTPIFIIGMPRSGTTLVEQIIASHPDVFGAGELTLMADLASSLHTRLDTDESFPDNIKLLTSEIAEQMANEYIQSATIDEPDCKRVTDKMPHNFRLLGLIELLFPNAKIVHCTRNPIDTCLSIYVNSFVSTHPYATDLKNAGIYYTDYYQEIMAHWKNVSSLTIMDINYESLVDNQEKLSRELIDFCGLEWSDNCLNFHKSSRDVATISYDQVRQPIYTKSSKRWKNYEIYLKPLIDHFGLEAH